jgi:hypothetical protein
MFRQIGDGVLAAPHRGIPPAAPKGYIVDPTNPFKFLLDIGECEYRNFINKKMGCCLGGVDRIQCKDKGRYVTRTECFSCKEQSSKLEKQVGIILEEVGINESETRDIPEESSEMGNNILRSWQEQS